LAIWHCPPFFLSIIIQSSVIQSPIIDPNSRHPDHFANFSKPKMIGAPPPDPVPDNLSNTGEIGPDGLPLDPTSQFPGIPSPPTIEPIPTEEEEEEDVPPAVRTRRLATIMICLNSMLGIGILGVPNGFCNTGFVTSLFLLFMMAGLSLVSTWMILVLCVHTSTKGFPELAAHVLGRAGSSALSILTLVFLICAVVAYLILGGDMLLSWFALAGISMKGLLRRALLVGVYSLVLPIALSIPRDISFLGYVSAATCAAVLFYAVVMIYEAITHVADFGIAKNARVNKMDVGIFSSIAMFGLSFALPACVMPAVRAYNPGLRKRKIVTGVSMTVVLVLVVISGVTGYMIFGEKAEANILNCFPDDNVVIVIVRAGFFVVVTCAYPMVLQTIEAAWSQVVFGDDYPAGLPTRKRTIVLILSNIVPLLIAMFVPNAKPVLEVGGSIGGCLVDFVFPGILWLKESDKKWTYWRNVLAILLAIIGLCVGLVACYLAVTDAIRSFT
jgi:amino acid permease